MVAVELPMNTYLNEEEFILISYNMNQLFRSNGTLNVPKLNLVMLDDDDDDDDDDDRVLL
jgi:hypothetical protein